MAALGQASPHDLLLLSRADRSEAVGLSALRAAFPGSELGAWDLRVQAGAAVQACGQAILKYLGPPPPIELVLPLSDEAWQELDAEGPARG